MKTLEELHSATIKRYFDLRVDLAILKMLALKVHEENYKEDAILVTLRRSCTYSVVLSFFSLLEGYNCGDENNSPYIEKKPRAAFPYLWIHKKIKKNEDELLNILWKSNELIKRMKSSRTAFAHSPKKTFHLSDNDITKLENLIDHIAQTSTQQLGLKQSVDEMVKAKLEKSYSYEFFKILPTENDKTS